MLQDVTNRSSEVGFHKAEKKERKKRAVEGRRIIFRPTVYGQDPVYIINDREKI